MAKKERIFDPNDRSYTDRNTASDSDIQESLAKEKFANVTGVAEAAEKNRTRKPTATETIKPGEDPCKGKTGLALIACRNKHKK